MNKLIVLVSLILGGCVTNQQSSIQWKWYKPHATTQDFAQDKYRCMAASQQNLSQTFVNSAGGVSTSNVITNQELFNACMNAQGWVLQQHEAS